MEQRTQLGAFWRALALMTVAFTLVLSPSPAAAQTSQRCFAETGYCIAGRIREYWERNGGLPVFGFPLSTELQENGRTVQYFERQRFEIHPENARPYDVLLGLLGAERLSSGAPAPVASGPSSGCIWFPETKHNVCNQQIGIGFASYWQTHGLEFDGLASKTYNESLALFGYPLTEAYDYTMPSGEVILTQWFERARFEWHPEKPNEYKVLLGLLGSEARPWTPGPWTPEPGPGLVSQVNIFLISTGGGNVGCGDQVVPVVRRITPTQAPLTAALNELFNLKTQTLGESGLYNALYQSDIRIDRVAIVNGRAEVNLSGTVRINGVCDKPRVIAQIEQTVRQFSTVTDIAITLNGASLADAIA